MELNSNDSLLFSRPLFFIIIIFFYYCKRVLVFTRNIADIFLFFFTHHVLMSFLRMSDFCFSSTRQPVALLWDPSGSHFGTCADASLFLLLPLFFSFFPFFFYLEKVGVCNMVCDWPYNKSQLFFFRFAPSAGQKR